MERHRRILLALAILATAGPASSLEPWVRQYSGSSLWPEAYSIAATADGGMGVLGRLVGGLPGSGPVVLRLDARGIVQWQRTFRSAIDPRVSFSLAQLVATADGGFIGAGYTGGGPDVDAWLVKLGAGGDIEWQRAIGTAEFDIATAVAATTDGGFAFAGETPGLSGTNPDLWVARLDAAGDLLWHRSWSTAQYERVRGIVEISDGDLLVAASVRLSSTDDDLWLVRLDPAGTPRWQRRYGEGLSEFLNDDLGRPLAATLDGGSVVAAIRENPAPPYYSAWLLRVNGGGGIVWQRAFGGTYDARLRAIAARPDGGFLVSGSVTTGGFGDSFGWVASLDPQGSSQWQRELHGTTLNFANSVALLADGSVAVAEEGNPLSGSGSTQMRLHRLDAAGSGCAPGPTVVTDLMTAAGSTITTAPERVLSLGSLASTAVAAYPAVGFAAVCAGPADGCTRTLPAPLTTGVSVSACGGPAPIVTSDPTPELSWSTVAGAIGYRFEVWTGSYCSGILAASGATAAGVTRASAPALADGSYTWRAVALGDGVSTCESPATCGCPFEVRTGGGCIDDGGEDDDTCPTAGPLAVGALASDVRLHCDPDWYQFDAIAGATYEIHTLDLRGGSDTRLALWRQDCAILIDQDDDGGGGGASLIRWTADATLPVRLEVSEQDGLYDGGRAYQVRVACVDGCGTTWARTYSEGPGGISPTADGGWAGALGSLMVKLDGDGIPQWSRSFAGLAGIGQMVPRAAGGYSITGHARSDRFAIGDLWLARLDQDGAPIWQQTRGGGGFDAGFSLADAADGGVLVGGINSAVGAGRYDGWAIKVDASGGRVWDAVIGLDGIDEVRDIAESADGGALVALQLGQTPTGGDAAVVVKVSAAGAIQWQRQFGAGFPGSGASIRALPDGGAVLLETGNAVLRLDAAGDTVWRTVPSSDVGFVLYQVIPLPDGGFAAAGIAGTAGAPTDGIVVRLAADGEAHWIRSYGGAADDSLYALAAGADSSVAAAGLTSSFGATADQGWLLRLDRWGGLDPSCPIVADRTTRATVSRLPYGQPASALVTGFGATSAAGTATTTVGQPSANPLCPRTSPPAEVSPRGSPVPLWLADDALSWEPGSSSGSLAFNVYRGTIAELRTDGLGSCLQAAVPTNATSDPTRPPAGTCWFYLVSGRNAAGEGPARIDGSLPRWPAVPCP